PFHFLSFPLSFPIILPSKRHFFAQKVVLLQAWGVSASAKGVAVRPSSTQLYRENTYRQWQT
ncbi:MAG: hypothetical protein ACFN4S_12000, partial [Prevotella conceptionensis]